ncbi:MAG: 2-amino-4-hydroxy-6-hydroxymethyldihydropteridine diphosphokinase [Bacteroidota bacterium]|nr:2-amino-4-hydroxy-6-hydroxymethyldihydropteridine diphosphokinase [Bacteroidota bacterium]
MASVYLSLGTNLGNREANLNEAVAMIEKRIGSLSSVSAFYQTAPWGFESENDFLNLVLACETKLSPESLLQETQFIEIELGRTKKSNGSYSDRMIDIDILYYEQLIVETPRLIIPHPLLHLREFVLAPLNEIAPLFLHPIFQKTTEQMLSELKNSSK